MFQGKTKPASNVISPLLIFQSGEEDPPSKPSHFGDPLGPYCHRDFLWTTCIKKLQIFCGYQAAVHGTHVSRPVHNNSNRPVSFVSTQS